MVNISESQVEAADAALLLHLRDGGALTAELARLRGFFLLGAPPAGDFAAGLFGLLDASLAPGFAVAAAAADGGGPAMAAGPGLLQVSPAVATVQLQQLLAATAAPPGGHSLPPADRITGVLGCS